MAQRTARDPDRFLRDNSISNIRQETVTAGALRGLFLWARFSMSLFWFRIWNQDIKTIEESEIVVGRSLSEFLKKALRKSARDKLDHLKAAEGEPYLLIRCTAPVFYFFSQRNYSLLQNRRKEETKYRKRMFGLDAMAAGFLYYLGARPQYHTIAAKNRRGQFARDLLSAPGQAEIAERDGFDMPLRFHQSIVENSFPGCPASKTYGVTCIFKTYFGLRNWRQIPIYLLPVRDVIRNIPEEEREEVLEQLQRRAYSISAPLSDGSYDAFARPLHEGLPLLFPGNHEGDWLLSFDPNRLVEADDDRARKAVSDLRKAIQAAQREGCTKRIIVRFRDLLIVDNLRALVSRREFDPVFWDSARLIVGPKERWLRQMYGTPLEI